MVFVGEQNRFFVTEKHSHLVFNLFEDIPHGLLVNGICVLAIPRLIRWNVDRSDNELRVCAFYGKDHISEHFESISHCHFAPEALAVSNLHGMEFC